MAAQFASTKARARGRSLKLKLSDLWQHQKETYKRARPLKSFLDASDPGTGKTLSALYLYNQRRIKKQGKCALILAPRTLLQSAWGVEIQRYFPHLKYSVAYAKNRKEAFQENVDIYITNLDAVKWLADQNRAFFEKFDTLIIDELSAYKHRTSQRSRAISKIKSRFEFKHGLTGTPTSNSVTDMWHQIFILDNGQRLGANFYAFRNVVCAPDPTDTSGFTKWLDKPGAEEAVINLIDDMSIRHDFDECMDIPPNFVHTVPFRLDNSHWKKYLRLEDDAVLELQQDRVTAVHAAALRTKLLQVASGAVYTEKGYKVIDNSRNELILDLVCERQHSIVFFNWNHQKKQLIAEAKKRGIEYEFIDGTVTSDKRRDEIVEEYQAGHFQTLFLHPKTGAHGLTLTKGTATIWSSPIYEPDILKQGLHRIYRGGQTMKTETILVCALGTVEERVYEILQRKQRRMVTLLDLMQRSV